MSKNALCIFRGEPITYIHTCLPLSAAFLFQVVPSFLAMSACHLLLGRLLDLFPLLECHSLQHLVHLLSFILAIIMSGWSPLLLQCVVYNVNYLCSFCWSLSMVPFLVALDFTFSSPLLFERFSVCLSIVYWETTFDSLRSLLVRHTGPLLVFWVIWGVVCLGLFPSFFSKQLHTALILA